MIILLKIFLNVNEYITCHKVTVLRQNVCCNSWKRVVQTSHEWRQQNCDAEGEILSWNDLQGGLHTGLAILAAYFLAVNALIMRHRVCNVYLLGVCLCVVSQLQDYKTIAQSLERRIVDLH